MEVVINNMLIGLIDIFKLDQPSTGTMMTNAKELSITRRIIGRKS